MSGIAAPGQAPASKSGARIGPHTVVVESGIDATYRVIALSDEWATLVRCTRDNVMYPGALLRRVPMEQFRAWLPYQPKTALPPSPYDF